MDTGVRVIAGADRSSRVSAAVPRAASEAALRWEEPLGEPAEEPEPAPAPVHCRIELAYLD
ncbi:hypothetical protein ACFYNO_13110 [Kitasatospora sp. NPDC006697]|uniref:hypothetical protein n=1 Tax=Kitasatospora sp. NPDC006697 TaxID=3364020 RepID=UPI0036BD94F3